jgi:outer membrane receptor protein involved in Fe transport
LLENEESDSRIWYKNELIFKSDLPAFNQNRPIIVNLLWVAELPARFTFTNLSRYRSGYRQIVPTGEFRPLPERRIDPDTGEEILDAAAVYEEIKHSGKVIFDWKLGWSTPVYHQQGLNFSLEINNVFNSRTRTGGTTTTYEMGRQFWAGVAYDF